MAFNYFSYSRHVFTTHRLHVVRFVGAYVFNYALSVVLLGVAHRLIASPYGAGFCVLVVTSLLNYFVLKRFVVGASGVGRGGDR